MSSDYRRPSSGSQEPNSNDHRPNSESWGGSWEVDDEDTQPHRAIPPPSASSAQPASAGEIPQQQTLNPQISYREHVTGALPAYPSDAPLFRPAYMPYPPPQPSQQTPGYPQPGQGAPGWGPGNPPYRMPGYPPQEVSPYQGNPAWNAGNPTYPGYPGYPPPPYYAGYNGYAPYYGWQQPQPKRDSFHLAVSIISLIGSILAILGGLASALLLVLFLISTSAHTTGTVISNDQYFSGLLTFTAFVLAGTVGGGFSLFHSIRALLRKPSASFALPWFWLFIILYLLVVGVGYALQASGKEVASLPLTICLIILAAIFPAFALVAFGARRLRFPEWTTSWRRFALALTSGATLGIGLALLLELGFLILLVRTQGAVNFQKCIDNPDQPGCGSFTTFNLIFLVVAIIGPVIEETVKPLAVAFFIGRMRSASEAFILGMAAGVGFAMIETVGYIGAGYHDWLPVALERTGASLLHGFGAAMVALGWYYLTHPSKERHLLKAFGCWAYAVFQHFVWNGTAVLSLLPGPVGSTINSWNLHLGFVTLPFVEILNIVEAIFILIFFIYMTGRLRRDIPSPPSSQESERESPQFPVYQAGFPQREPYPGQNYPVR